MTLWQSLLMDARAVLDRSRQLAPNPIERAAVERCIHQVDRLLLVSTAGPADYIVQDRSSALRQSLAEQG
jgi:hypothetical protein